MEANHNKPNEALGLPDDPPTKALFEFVAEASKKRVVASGKDEGGNAFRPLQLT
jgi:hypothetical protein